MVIASCNRNGASHIPDSIPKSPNFISDIPQAWNTQVSSGCLSKQSELLLHELIKDHEVYKGSGTISKITERVFKGILSWKMRYLYWPNATEREKHILFDCLKLIRFMRLREYPYPVVL